MLNLKQAKLDLQRQWNGVVKEVLIRNHQGAIPGRLRNSNSNSNGDGDGGGHAGEFQISDWLGARMQSLEAALRGDPIPDNWDSSYYRDSYAYEDGLGGGRLGGSGSGGSGGRQQLSVQTTTATPMASASSSSSSTALAPTGQPDHPRWHGPAGSVGDHAGGVADGPGHHHHQHQPTDPNHTTGDSISACYHHLRKLAPNQVRRRSTTHPPNQPTNHARMCFVGVLLLQRERRRGPGRRQHSLSAQSRKLNTADSTAYVRACVRACIGGHGR